MKHAAGCFIVVILILFCSCAPKSSCSGGSSLPVSTPEPGATPSGEPLTLLMDGSQQWSLQNTDDGYYDIVNQPDGSQLIYYTDFGQLIQVPLCSSINCDHKSEVCTAWTTANGMFVYQDHLYQFQIPVDSSPYLERADLNGMNREPLVRLPSGEDFVPSGVAATGDTLFFATAELKNEYSTVNATYKINKLDLSSGSIEVIQRRENTNQFIVGVLEDKLLIKRFEMDPDSETIIMPEFLLMDQLGNEELIELPDFVTGRTWIFPEGSCLLILDDSEGSIISLDLTTKQTHTVIKDPFLSEHPGATLILAASGDNLIINIGADYYICTDNGIVKSSHCYFRGIQPSNKILARVNDNYLVCRDFNSCPKTLAFISVADFLLDADTDVPIKNE